MVMEDLEKIKAAGMKREDMMVRSAFDIFGGNLAYKDVAWRCQQEGPWLLSCFKIGWKMMV